MTPMSNEAANLFNSLVTRAARVGFRFDGGYASDIVRDIEKIERDKHVSFHYVGIRENGTSITANAKAMSDLIDDRNTCGFRAVYRIQRRTHNYAPDSFLIDDKTKLFNAIKPRD